MREDNDLILATSATDRVRVRFHFFNDAASGYAVNEIVFADSVWTADDIKRKALQAGAGNDTITGYASNDALEGFEGDDQLDGRGGNDTLTGGAGNDLLIGEKGNDVYRFSAGHGRDVIVNGVSGENAIDRIELARASTAPASA